MSTTQTKNNENKENKGYVYKYEMSKGDRQGTHLLSQQMGVISDNTMPGSGGSRHGGDISTLASCPVKISVEILHALPYNSICWFWGERRFVDGLAT